MTPAEYTLSFYLLLVLSFIFLRIKYINKPIRGFNTLIHESSHAITSLLFQGRIVEIRLFSDTSGLTITENKSRFSSIIVAFVGYPMPVLFALGMLWLNDHGMDYITLYILLSIVIANLILFVRNAYGIIWLLSFIAICILLLIYGGELSIGFFVLFLVFILLTSGIYDTFLLMLLSFKKGHSAGDASTLHKLTGFPAQFWAILFLLLNSMISLYVILTYFPLFNELTF